MGGKDITNQRFGKLIAINRVPEKYDGKHTYWRCICDCGKEVIVRTDQLTRGITASCGCYEKSVARQLCMKRNYKHGLRCHPLYNTWYKMRMRCSKATHPDYKNYGARGIQVCNEWSDFKVFYDWAMQNGWSKGLEIDRIDNNGPYSPENCRWVDRVIQANNKRTNIRIEYQGRIQTLSEWCKELEIPYPRTQQRLYAHKPLSEVFMQSRIRKNMQNK